MNIQQLEYIIAVDTYRHFAISAEKSFVTQPTLSMMIQKLEEELDVKLFDRTKQPVVPTEIGKCVIAQAKRVLTEIKQIKEIINEYKGDVKGELKIGIIPTLAPYLLPMFINDFISKYPAVFLKISELTTPTIVDRLAKHQIDLGIMATPVTDISLLATPLFYEPFVIYGTGNMTTHSDKRVSLDEIDVSRVWLLEEGHCLRSQVINLCDLKRKETELHKIDYEAGSIETLKKMVEITNGITILPELAIQNLTEEQKRNIQFFKPPVPVREISMVTYRHEVKRKLIEVLTEEILLHIPDELKTQANKQVTPI